MFSTSRRWTASSSAIKMVAVMALPARYNYLYRIGALWLTVINALLRFVAWRHVATAALLTEMHGKVWIDNGFAFFLRFTQICGHPQTRFSSQTGSEKRRRHEIGCGAPAGMESRGSLCRNRCARGD